ncbi:hypothetical protein OFO10_04210 [Campylobacter sp. VBCF_06 NA8]|uniref:hypothetical protein n=1 Tax=unclassified Campylobacter TaxID=2593542 RepID=UPI001B3E60B5|nr:MULTISPECIES: hypothetical protein [unclassified Campylobacter]MBP3223731.1 hypothetical protein [Campylobacter sp.]MDA3046354.1 hypothetical protein [Campylobacter sp. VBCF_06 NA8]MDA3076331.1 hypothetical protein [Campylobacter sp. JMF_04 NA10]
MDFLESLNSIKKDMIKEEKAKNPPKPKPKPNPNRDEFKDIFKDEDLADESVSARENRLKDEFLKYIENANIRKI